MPQVVKQARFDGNQLNSKETPESPENNIRPI